MALKFEDVRRVLTAEEEAKRSFDRGAGALESLYKDLKEEFGVESLEKGEKVLKSLESSYKEAMQEAEKEYELLRKELDL